MNNLEIKKGDYVIPYGRYAKDFFELQGITQAKIINKYQYRGKDWIHIEYYSKLKDYFGNTSKYPKLASFSLTPRSPYRVVKLPEIEWE
jgi:GDP-D-mannose dehydratase